jgi:hypothetical protein
MGSPSNMSAYFEDALLVELNLSRQLQELLRSKEDWGMLGVSHQGEVTARPMQCNQNNQRNVSSTFRWGPVFSRLLFTRMSKETLSKKEICQTRYHSSPSS